MAEETMASLDAWRKGAEPAGDFLREAVRWLRRELLEGEVSAQIGAERSARSEARTPHRNGYRRRPWDTRRGSLDLAIPELRAGSHFPGWWEPRRRAEQALGAVVAEAYVQGVSTRKVEALVQALGIPGLSQSEVSRLGAGLDEPARVFRPRRRDAAYPCPWLDTRYEHVPEHGRVQSMAVLLAYGVRADGVREVLGLGVGLSEDVALWRGFLQDLVARGVRGVQLVTSDAPAGLEQAVAEVFVGASRGQALTGNGAPSIPSERNRPSAPSRGSGSPRDAPSSSGGPRQRNDMVDLQPVVMDDDALDEQLQDGLPVLEGGLG